MPRPLFQPGNMAAKGHGQAKYPKPYSVAAMEYLQMRHGDAGPKNWPEKREDWTFAQYLVERHASQAAAGDMDAVRWLVERAEGKTPTAPEDREAKAASDATLLLGGMTALGALRQILGLPPAPAAIDTEVVE